jgi:hypothetical protein
VVFHTADETIELSPDKQTSCVLTGMPLTENVTFKLTGEELGFCRLAVRVAAKPCSRKDWEQVTSLISMLFNTVLLESVSWALAQSLVSEIGKKMLATRIIRRNVHVRFFKALTPH